MKCRSGQHEWSNEKDARHCCQPGWKRILLVGPEIKEHPQELLTVIPGEQMAHAWVNEAAR